MNIQINRKIRGTYRRSRSAERLLRSLGASGKLVGFKYLVYIAEMLLKLPNEERWLTKNIYPETAKHFRVGYDSVDKAIRTLITKCWERKDHSMLDRIAGSHLDKRPTSAQFIDMLVAYLR